MAVQASPKTGFEKWQEGINGALDDARWSSWDCEIQMAVNEYNRHLSGVAGYTSLDWQLIKAMVWVETGAENSQWMTKPMQIGVVGDPGMSSLLSGNEGGDLILSTEWKARLTPITVRTNPAHNIRAGIGYLLMKAGNYEYRSVPNADARVYQVTVKPGDSFDKIARSQGITVEILKQLNPGSMVLRPGQVLKYQKASMQRVITNWRNLSTNMVAQRYNGGGDPNYAKKLDYALSLIRKGKAAVCIK
ncbi:LysM peptidoglycan-binding domain-containing protein [Acidovorax sp. GBBC 3334]|uniref:LysM peptidoglycan-binding domain-containing protein n=1 Tax=Acidovorax sp. GBBC 3334 TaxID=2940496 RepID=UPI00230366BB|nr:LysM domain-containing protein [Acidovorax sp. GBBC 3334]MDA8454933.1 LysM peptidoglycan-binding domain-containing protein [Acidovorax sp. GBBC 3334]